MTPILIQNVITNFVNLLDNIMVGRVGTEQMSGVAIVNQLFLVFNLCIFGGLAGAGIFTAQFYGKKDNDGIRDTMRTKFIIAAAASLLFALLFFFRGENLISLFIHEGEEDLDPAATLGYAKNYMHIMLIQIFPFAAAQVYASTQRETGETVLPMVAGIAAVVLNTFLNYVLIFGKLGAPAMGVTGAAIATVTARFAECLIVVLRAHIKKNKYPYIRGVFRPARLPGRLLRQIAVKGLPLLLNELLWSSGMTMLNRCYSLRGLEVVSAVNIATTVNNLFFCAFLAMGTAISIIVGQLLGSGELERAVEEDRKMIAFSVLLSVAVAAMMACFAPLIPQIYNTTQTVRSIATHLLLAASLLMPINAFSNASYFTLRSGGKTAVTFIFDSGFVWLLNVPLAVLLSQFTDVAILPMYLMVQGIDILKVVLGFLLLKSRKWVNNLVTPEQLENPKEKSQT